MAMNADTNRHLRFFISTVILTAPAKASGRRLHMALDGEPLTGPTARVLSTASRTRRLLVEPRDDRIGYQLAILPRSANGAPKSLVDSLTGKPNDIV
jgi:hypothetical protein